MKPGSYVLHFMTHKGNLKELWFLFVFNIIFKNPLHSNNAVNVLGGGNWNV